MLQLVALVLKIDPWAGLIWWAAAACIRGGRRNCTKEASRPDICHYDTCLVTWLRFRGTDR